MKDLSLTARIFFSRIVILAGVLLLTFYLFFRISFVNFSPLLIVFSIILLLAELHTIFHLYGMFYSLWPRKYREFNILNRSRKLGINIFICVCGEPADIVASTIQAALKSAQVYNQKIKPLTPARVIVLNDGKVAGKDNWREIEQVAYRHGVDHIARTIPGGFKAGNINNGLKLTPTSDPHNTLDVVFDADFSAKEDFLLEITKPFVDKGIDFAQSPQRYKNEETWVAKASAAHQIFFFDHICRAKGHDNALFLCGTNFAIRRSAFDSVGGMDTRFITEDYATSLELHLNGKKGVFIPKVLAEGIAPSTLKAYFNQQQRWSKGSFDVSFIYLSQLLFGPLTIKQKFHYLLSASYYLIGIRDLILMLAPLPYLFFGVSLLKENTLQYLLLIYAPLLVYNFILYARLFRHPIKSLVLDIASFPVFTASFLSSLLKKDLSFIVTIKKYEKENPFSVYKIQLAIVALLTIGLLYGLQHQNAQGGSFLNYFWALFDTVVLSFGFYLIARENFNTDFIEKAYFKVHNLVERVVKLPLVIVPKTLYTLFFVALIGYGAMQLPAFNSMANMETLREVVSPVPAKELLVPDQGIYYGYYLSELNAHPSEPKTSVLPGEKTSLVMFYQDWKDQTDLDTAFLTKLASDGRTPIITWEPWDSTVSGDQGQYSLKSIIEGKHDRFIRRWATSARNYKQPFFLRFAHEMNGNWYPWGNKSEEYKQAWQHLHRLFQEEGASNVLWLWSPNNTDQFGSPDSILNYYPGDNYVDWTGFSGFNWGKSSKITRWVSFKQLAFEAYTQLTRINKPIMVTETSSSSIGGDKNQWFTQTLEKDLTEFPRVKGVVFFSETVGQADFDLTSGMDTSSVLTKSLLNNGYYLQNPLYKQK